MLVSVQNVDRCEQKWLKMLVWVQKMDRYERRGIIGGRAPSNTRESPAVKAGLIRVYGVVNLYLTFLDDLFEVYLIGIQVDR